MGVGCWSPWIVPCFIRIVLSTGMQRHCLDVYKLVTSIAGGIVGVQSVEDGQDPGFTVADPYSFRFNLLTILWWLRHRFLAEGGPRNIPISVLG